MACDYSIGQLRSRGRKIVDDSLGGFDGVPNLFRSFMFTCLTSLNYHTL